MLKALINVIDTVGTAILKRFPKSFQRQIDPDSIMGQALGVVLAIALLIGVAAIIYKIK